MNIIPVFKMAKLSKADKRKLEQKIKKEKNKKDSARLLSSINVKSKFIRIAVKPAFTKKPRSVNPHNYKVTVLTAHIASFFCDMV